MTIKGSKQVKIDHTFSLFSTSFEITGKPDGSEKDVLFLIRNPHLNLTVTQGDAHFPFCLLEGSTVDKFDFGWCLVSRETGKFTWPGPMIPAHTSVYFLSVRVHWILMKTSKLLLICWMYFPV